MDALNTMNFGDLPPAGEGVCLGPRLPLPAFDGYRDLWLNSGTAALALAMLHAHWQRIDVKQPEVILPAYGCPDLVSAAVYAGVKPVLVDVQQDDPAYDLQALEKALSTNTVAVVAVNFLGIGERLNAIRQRLPADVMLIEDNAQWHPEPDVTLEGDYVVTSFGRGKPASVLGGGLLLIRQELPLDRDWIKEQFAADDEAVTSISQHRLKAMTYNLLRKPPAYFWLNRSGVFRLGETRYEPLEGIINMSPACQSLVATNVQRYLALPRWREDFYDEVVSELPGLAEVAMERRRRLLRYPLLCESEQQRNEILETLNKQGLGASALYRRPLWEVSGVAENVLIKEEPRNATSFSNRLLTLPLHSGVQRSHLEKIAASLQSLAGQAPMVPLQQGVSDSLRSRQELR